MIFSLSAFVKISYFAQNSFAEPFNKKHGKNFCILVWSVFKAFPVFCTTSIFKMIAVKWEFTVF